MAALEIPNAIAVAAVIAFDPDADPGEKFTLLANAGILAKISEGVVATQPCAFFSLENPLAAQEAVPISQYTRLASDGGGPAAPQAYAVIVQIKDGPIADAVYDALPDGTLFVGVAEAEVPVVTGFAILRVPRG